MRIDNESAYVLHARPWRESSLLIEVLSENHGRLGLLARDSDTIMHNAEATTRNIQALWEALPARRNARRRAARIA